MALKGSTFSKNTLKNAAQLKDFNSLVKKYGIGLSNFYGVGLFPLQTTSQLSTYLNRVGGDDWQEKTSYYCDEINIPGLQIATGEYRINGSPQFKYAHSSTYSEVSMSLIMDGNSKQKKIFDAWLNFIYGMSSSDAGSVSTTLPLAGFKNAGNQIGRVMYPDDYIADIYIVKYERYGNGYSNTKNKTGVQSIDNILDNLSKSLNPDSQVEVNNAQGKSIKFPNSEAQYSIRLIDAFPTSVSSLPLSAGSSQLLRVNITFEYKYHLTNALESGQSVFDSTPSYLLPK